jgi:phage-related protein
LRAAYIKTDIITRKPVAWLGDSLDAIRKYPEVARQRAGRQLANLAKFPEAIYVLHAFQKKSRKTSKADIELARTRYRAMLNERKNQ